MRGTIIPGERNRGIDIIRAGCILLIIIYHLYAVLDSPPIPSKFVQSIVHLGGETGVTGFFMLSGYGIYCSLERQYEKKGTFSYGAYLKRRAWRILPQYYANLFILLCISGSAGLGSSYNIKILGVHLLCMQGFTLAGRAMINGAVWAVSIIVQFYLIAPLLYKVMKRWSPVFVAIGGSIFTIACKYLVFHFTSLDGFYAGRQLFTSLDNFLLGMFLAYLWQKQKKRLHPGVSLGGCILMIPVFYGLCRYGLSAGLHRDNFSGCTWHTAMAWTLLLVFWLFMQIPVNERNPVNKVFLWIAKYEYGIFLWHLPLIRKITSDMPFAWLRGRNLYLPAIGIVFFTIMAFGWFMTIAVDEGFVPWVKARWKIENKESKNG